MLAVLCVACCACLLARLACLLCWRAGGDTQHVGEGCSSIYDLLFGGVSYDAKLTPAMLASMARQWDSGNSAGAGVERKSMYELELESQLAQVVCLPFKS